MSKTSGIFTISLDFELYWGMRDKYTITEYRKNLEGVAAAVKGMLEIFDKYEVHATWATVGMLFAEDINTLRQYTPSRHPNYINNSLNPYLYIDQNKQLEKSFHFAPELIDLISKYKGQEIGSHTFSHYYCLENGQTKADFLSDMQSAVAIAQASKIELKSLVFPRNQWNNEYLSVLEECGITCYRGNEKSWLYRAANTEQSNLIKRAIRLTDAYLNISGPNSYSLTELTGSKPYNIPSSRFLRPYNKKLAVLDGMRKNRIKQAIKHAAKKGDIFHLWWHPHNFGTHTKENLSILEDILNHYKKMNQQYAMQALNMGEISDLLASVRP